jgi:hypothetical protein
VLLLLIFVVTSVVAIFLLKRWELVNRYPATVVVMGLVCGLAATTLIILVGRAIRKAVLSLRR